MKKNSIILLVFLLGVALYYYLSVDDKDKGPQVRINNEYFYVDMADSEEEWTRGLSVRESLDKDRGLLFIFPDKKNRSFWMKDMNFPIDLVWINDNMIVGIEENMPVPDKEADLQDLPRYRSPQAVNYALEINAGLVNQLDIKVGDQIYYLIDR